MSFKANFVDFLSCFRKIIFEFWYCYVFSHIYCISIFDNHFSGTIFWETQKLYISAKNTQKLYDSTKSRSWMKKMFTLFFRKKLLIKHLGFDIYLWYRVNYVAYFNKLYLIYNGIGKISLSAKSKCRTVCEKRKRIDKAIFLFLKSLHNSNMILKFILNSQRYFSQTQKTK